MKKTTIYYISFLEEPPWAISKDQLCQYRFKRILEFDFDDPRKETMFKELNSITRNTICEDKFFPDYRLAITLESGRIVYVNSQGRVLMGKKSYVLQPSFFLWLYVFLKDV